MWGNVKCTDRVGGVGWCNGRCDGVCDGVWLFGKDSFEECPLTESDHVAFHSFTLLIALCICSSVVCV